MAIKIISKDRAQLIVSTGSDSKGTRKRVTKTVTYTGKKDLKEKYRQFEAEVSQGPSQDMTVGELLESYLNNAEVRGLSANTLHGYKSAQKRINSAFKDVLAKELTTYQVDDFIAQMSKKYATKTIHNTIGLLEAAYERAIRTDQLATNPCKKATLPKHRKKEIRTLPPDQLHAFLDELAKQTLDLKVGYELCLMCGLRRGEVLGLKESDVNLPFRQITINKTRYIVEGKEHVQDTKTDRSKRTLALPKVLADDIAQLISEHHSKPYKCSDRLIQNAFGKPLSPSVFSTKISKLEQAAGIDHVTAHGLRHTFATLLNAQHVDIAQISVELGHSNLATTLNIYTHVFGDVTSSSRGIADAIDNVFEEKGANGAQAENKKAAEA